MLDIQMLDSRGLMEQFLYIVLGALLAAGGSFLAQRNQMILNRKESDQKIILDIVATLNEYDGVLEAIDHTPKESAVYDTKVRLYELTVKQGKLIESLIPLTIQISSKKYQTFSVQVTKFALHESFRTTDNLNELTRCGYMLVNEEMIKAYESEIE